MRSLQKNQKKEFSVSSRETILKSAAALFAEKGFDGTTVRDIAKKAGANLCLISYYFGGKEGLLRAYLEEIGKNRLATTKEQMQPPKSAAQFFDSISQIVLSMAESHGKNPEVSKILSHEIEHGLPIARDIFESTFLLLMKNLIAYLQAGQRAGYVKKSVNCTVLAFLIQSTLSNITRSVCVAEKYFSLSLLTEKQRKQVTDTLLETILFGFMETSYAKKI